MSWHEGSAGNDIGLTPFSPSAPPKPVGKLRVRILLLQGSLKRTGQTIAPNQELYDLLFANSDSGFDVDRNLDATCRILKIYPAIDI